MADNPFKDTVRPEMPEDIILFMLSDFSSEEKIISGSAASIPIISKSRSTLTFQ